MIPTIILRGAIKRCEETEAVGGFRRLGMASGIAGTGTLASGRGQTAAVTASPVVTRAVRPYHPPLAVSSSSSVAPTSASGKDGAPTSVANSPPHSPLSPLHAPSGGHATTASSSTTSASASSAVPFLYGPLLDQYASQPLTPVTLQSLSQITPTQLISNAAYLQKELPIRVAKRAKAMRALPFIVASNPHIHKVYQLYLRSFKELLNVRKVFDEEGEIKWCMILQELIKNHAEVIPQMAQGFLECRKYLNRRTIQTLVDDMIRSRISIRVLAEHHVALHTQFYESARRNPATIGIIHTSLRPYRLIRSCADFVSDLCEIYLGASAPVTVEMQDPELTFTYIPVHLEYIMIEILKNSMRATVERFMCGQAPGHGGVGEGDGQVPPIQVTIASDPETRDITIRVRDRGGGIPYSLLERVFDYSYTTVPQGNEDVTMSPSSHHRHPQAGLFTHHNEKDLQRGLGGQLAGLGYGLGTARVYCAYFGGGLRLVSLHGFGADTFIKLRNINKKMDTEI